MLGSLLIWLHVSGNLIWIGAILAVGVLLSATPPSDQSEGGSADFRAWSKLRGALAVRVYLRLAVPAFVVSFLCGATRLLMDPAYYLVAHHWMHPKLVAALAVIGLHHVIGARAKAAAKDSDPAAPKELARGTVQPGRATAMLSIVLAMTAALAAFFAIFRIPG